jgi:hypothetical protein
MFTNNVVTLALGSRPRQKFTNVRAESEAQESHFMFSGVQEGVKEWTHTFPSGLPFWELESQWTLKISENNYKGQNSLD